MLRLRMVAFLFLAGLVLGAAGVARAAKPAEAEPARGEQGMPNVVLDREGKEQYDLSKPEDAHRLVESLKGLKPGERKELIFERPATLLEQWADLGIWTFVVFLVLLFILGRYAWKPMLEGLHKREESIRGSIEEAERARAEAQRLREQLQQEMNQSEQRVRQLLDEGRRDAQRLRDEMLAQTKAEIQTERERLHREIDLARDQALHQIWSQAAQLATAISGKVLRRRLTPEDHRELVDEALSEMRQTGNGR